MCEFTYFKWIYIALYHFLSGSFVHLLQIKQNYELETTDIEQTLRIGKLA